MALLGSLTALLEPPTAARLLLRKPPAVVGYFLIINPGKEGPFEGHGIGLYMILFLRGKKMRQ